MLTMSSSRVEELGYQAHVIQGVERTVVAAVGDERGKERLTSLEALPLCRTGRYGY